MMNSFRALLCMLVPGMLFAQNGTVDSEESSLLKVLGKVTSLVNPGAVFKSIDTLEAPKGSLMLDCRSDSVRMFLTQGDKSITAEIYLRDKKISPDYSYWNYVTLEAPYNGVHKNLESAMKELIKKSSVSFEKNAFPEPIPSYYDTESPLYIFYGELQNGVLNGPANYYFWEYNTLAKYLKRKATGNYVNNKRDGLWKSFFKDEVFDKDDYKDFDFHKKNGIDNSIQFQGMYANGFKTGGWIEITSVKTYKHSDFFVRFLDAGFDLNFTRQVLKGNYENGYKTGNWTVCSESNLPIANGSYAKGGKTESWIYYNLFTGKPSLRVQFANDAVTDTIRVIEETVSQDKLSKDLRWDNVTLNVFPVFIKGIHWTKTTHVDQSSILQQWEFIHSEKEIEVKKAGAEIRRDAYGRLVNTTRNKTDSTAKNVRIIIPKIQHVDEVPSVCYAANLQYMAKMTDAHIELWSLENYALLGAFEHKIESSNADAVSLSGDGRIAIVDVNDNFHYEVDFQAKTVTKKDGQASTDYSRHLDLQKKGEAGYEEGYHTFNIGFYSKYSKNKFVKISLAAISHVKSPDMLTFEISTDERYISFANAKQVFVYNLALNKIIRHVNRPDGFSTSYKLRDSVTLVYENASGVFLFNMSDSSQRMIGGNIFPLGIEEADIVNGKCYIMTYNPDADNQYGVKMNLGTGLVEFGEARAFLETVPVELRKRNGFSSRYFLPPDVRNVKGKLEEDHPAQPYWKNEPYCVHLRENNFDNSFFCVVNDYKDLIHYNQQKKTLLHKPVCCNLFSNHNYIFYTPDQYYCGSKGIGQVVKFEMDLQQYAFEQFDLKYNRPDIVLDRLGYSDSSTIAAYHNAYIKRLKRMGFTEDMLKSDFHLPEIMIENKKQLPTQTDSSSLDLDLDIRDTKYKLDRINIFINDVPVFGSAGIDLRKNNVQEHKQKVHLLLADGENKIQVSALNQAGAESYKETIHVKCRQNENAKPGLYVITIGDSKYKDSRFDLSYAAKDAEDIVSAFRESTTFKEVHAYTYTNEKVTKENILKLKEELKKARRDDVVIITVAGHGVLDKDLNYYLATYDMDFNNPSAKGLPYEELESLVDGIAPLKKVILLDACHSGEVDKEEVEQLAMANTNSGEVKFRAAGAGIQKKNLGLKTTSELMGELFTDLRRGTGATVISSAGGVEYAMESDEWKNGLFTYCLLHGLKDKAADANKDGQIMLSELQQYLRTQVTKLSNGAQQPTSRIENLTMDFRVW